MKYLFFVIRCVMRFEFLVVGVMFTLMGFNRVRIGIESGLWSIDDLKFMVFGMCNVLLAVFLPTKNTHKKPLIKYGLIVASILAFAIATYSLVFESQNLEQLGTQLMVLFFIPSVLLDLNIAPGFLYILYLVFLVLVVVMALSKRICAFIHNKPKAMSTGRSQE